MAKLTKTKPKCKVGRRAHKRDSVVIPTPAAGNHATRRKVARAAARAAVVVVQ
jgi:hypothetical protein